MATLFKDAEEAKREARSAGQQVGIKTDLVPSSLNPSNRSGFGIGRRQASAEPANIPEQDVSQPSGLGSEKLTYADFGMSGPESEDTGLSAETRLTYADFGLQEPEKQEQVTTQQVAPASEPPPEEEPGFFSRTLRSLAAGFEQTTGMAQAAGQTYIGDTQGVVETTKETQAGVEKFKTKEQKAFEQGVQARKRDADGLWEGVKNVAQGAVENPEGVFQFVMQQAPNSAVSLGFGWAGLKVGAAAGAALGPGGILIGGTVGFLTGLFAGNTLLETGGKAQEAAADGEFTATERAKVIKEGTVKGATITGVDAITLGASKFMMGAASRAVDRATTKVLSDRGIDATVATAAIQDAQQTALKAAAGSPPAVRQMRVAEATIDTMERVGLASDDLVTAVRKAQGDALKLTNGVGKRLARAGGAMALETVGEGAGEYLGELAATGKADVTDAVMESVAGLTMSVGELATVARTKPDAGKTAPISSGIRAIEARDEAKRAAETAPPPAGTEAFPEVGQDDDTRFWVESFIGARGEDGTPTKTGERLGNLIAWAKAQAQPSPQSEGNPERLAYLDQVAQRYGVVEEVDAASQSPERMEQAAETARLSPGYIEQFYIQLPRLAEGPVGPDVRVSRPTTGTRTEEAGPGLDRPEPVVQGMEVDQQSINDMTQDELIQYFNDFLDAKVEEISDPKVLGDVLRTAEKAYKQNNLPEAMRQQIFMPAAKRLLELRGYNAKEAELVLNTQKVFTATPFVTKAVKPTNEEAAEVRAAVAERLAEKNIQVSRAGIAVKPASARANTLARIFGIKALTYSIPGGEGKFAKGQSFGPGVVAINASINTQEEEMFVLSHEILHSLKTKYPSQYAQLINEIDALLSQDAPGEYQNTRERLVNIGYKFEDTSEEVVADITGFLFTQESFWNGLAARNTPLADRILNVLSGIIESIRAFIDSNQNERARIAKSLLSQAQGVEGLVSNAIETTLRQLEAERIGGVQTSAQVQAGLPSQDIQIGSVTLTGRSPFLAKDQAKADKANKFIGRGSSNSSTNQYAQDFGAAANSGEYTSNDVVFISAEGNRRGRIGPNFTEIRLAIEAGATIITDDRANRERPYNIGERDVAKFLESNGYGESKPGTWTPKPQVQAGLASIDYRKTQEGVTVAGPDEASRVPLPKPIRSQEPVRAQREEEEPTTSVVGIGASSELKKRIDDARVAAQKLEAEVEAAGGKEAFLQSLSNKELPRPVLGKTRLYELPVGDRLAAIAVSREDIPAQAQKERIAEIRAAGEKLTTDKIVEPSIEIIRSSLEKRIDAVLSDPAFQDKKDPQVKALEKELRALEKQNQQAEFSIRRLLQNMLATYIKDNPEATQQEISNAYAGMVDQQNKIIVGRINASIDSAIKISPAERSAMSAIQYINKQLAEIQAKIKEERQGGRGGEERGDRAKVRSDVEYLFEDGKAPDDPLIGDLEKRAKELQEEKQQVNIRRAQAIYRSAVLSPGGIIKKIAALKKLPDFQLDRPIFENINGIIGVAESMLVEGRSIQNALATEEPGTMGFSNALSQANDFLSRLGVSRKPEKDTQEGAQEDTEETQTGVDQEIIQPPEVFVDEQASSYIADRDAIEGAEQVRSLRNVESQIIESLSSVADLEGVNVTPLQDLFFSVPELTEPTQEQAELPIQESPEQIELDRRRTAEKLVQDAINNRLNSEDILKAFAEGVSNNDFGVKEIHDAAKKFGLLKGSLKDSSANLLSQKFFQTNYENFLSERGNTFLAKQEWMTSLDQFVTKWSDNSDVMQNVKKNIGEDAWSAYGEWVKERKSFLPGARQEQFTILGKNYNTLAMAFPRALFNRYTLNEIGNLGSIKEDARRIPLINMVSDPEAAYFNDIVAAIELRPDLEPQFKELLGEAAWERVTRKLDQNTRVSVQKAYRMARDPLIQFIQTANMSQSMYLSFSNAINHASVADFPSIQHAMNEITEIFNRERKAGRDPFAPVAELIKEFNKNFSNQSVELPEKDMMFNVVSPESISEFGDEIVEAASDAEGPESITDALSQLRKFRTSIGGFKGALNQLTVHSIVLEKLAGTKLMPAVEVYSNPAQLPEEVYERLKAEFSADVGMRGLFDGQTGRIYIFSDNVSSEAEVEEVLFHEAYGHYGLRALFGDKLDANLNSIYSTNKMVRELADKRMKDDGLSKLEAVDEVIADMAGEFHNHPEIWVRLKGAMVRLLRSLGWESLADKFENADQYELSYILYKSKEYAREGKGAPVMSGGLRLSANRTVIEMNVIRGKVMHAFARYNPLTETWVVTTAQNRGGDVRTDPTNYQTVEDEAAARAILNNFGKVTSRSWSPKYRQYRITSDLTKVDDALTNPTLLGSKTLGKWGRNARLVIQNRYLPIMHYVNYLKSVGKMTDSANVYDAILLYSGRVGAKVEDFDRQVRDKLNPILESIFAKGGTRADVDDFLIALHAKERNDAIMKIDPSNEAGSGISSEDAAEALEAFKAQPYYGDLLKVRDFMQELSKNKVREMLASGLIDVNTAIKLDQYKNYVSLYGNMITNKDGSRTPLEDIDFDQFKNTPMEGRSFNVAGRDARRATGRFTEADNALANTLMSYASVLIRSEKNRVANHMLEMAEAYMDPADVTVQTVDQYQTIDRSGSVTMVDKQFSTRDRDVFVAKRNGRMYTMKFSKTGKGSFVESLSPMFYGQDPSVFDWFGKWNNLFSRLVTTYNPAFVLKNGLRDVQTAYFNAAQDPRIGHKGAAKMLRGMTKAMGVALRYELSNGGPKAKSLAAKLSPADKEWLSYLEELRSEGGLTFFLERKSAEAGLKELEALMQPKKMAPMNFIKNVTGALEYMSLPTEIGPRLSAYKTLREMGWSKKDAAIYAKELTVNFNMKGTQRALSNFYVFFNPAIQGGERILRDVVDGKPGAKLRLAIVGGQWMILGSVLNVLARAFGDDEDDGDGDPKRGMLDRLPQWKRNTSMVLFPNDVFTPAVPIAYGYNGFYAIGNNIADILLGKIPPGEGLKRSASAMLDAYSPIGTGVDTEGLSFVVNTLTPTAVTPAIQLMTNENRFGAPINQSSLYGIKKSDSWTNFRSANPLTTDVTRWLNDVTGGNKYKPGLIDVSAGTVDHLMSSYLPGVISDVYKGTGLITRIARGEDVAGRAAIPILDSFRAKDPEGFDAGAFRRIREFTQNIEAQVKNATTKEEVEAPFKEYPGVGGLIDAVKIADKNLRSLASELNEVENHPNATQEFKTKILNRMRELQKYHYAQTVNIAIKLGFDNQVYDF